MKDRAFFGAIIWIIYLGTLQILSWALSDAPLCILVSDKNQAENQPGNYACATLFEGIARAARFVWEHAGHDNVVAFGTLLIAVFTFTLYRSTTRLWEAGEKQIRAMIAISTKQDLRTRDALDIARAQFISAHRPKIILRDVHLIADTVHYLLVNIGSTEATILESYVRAEFVEDRTRFAPLRTTEHADLWGIKFAGGEAKELRCPMPDEVSYFIKWRDARRIGTDTRAPMVGKVYFVGAIVYIDERNVKRRSIFRRLWDDASLTFIRLTPEQERDHEYAD